MSEYVKANRERNLQAVIDQTELNVRRGEAWVVKRPDHIDLMPPFREPNGVWHRQWV